MKILSIDPSSTKTGFALLDERETLLDAGTLRPNKTTDAAEYRVAAMCRDLENLLIINAPDIVVIEWTSGKVGRRHKGYGAGLAVYGIAIGAIWRTAVIWAAKGAARQVITIYENEWTAGKSKSRRSGLIKTLYPKIDLSKDTDGDIADAIGLGAWYIRRYKQNLVIKAQKNTPNRGQIKKKVYI